MSTGRMDVRATEEPQSRSPATFGTRDFYLACYLRCTGYELLNLRPEGQRRVFVFKDRTTRREDVISFYGEGGIVHALAFAAAIKDMKALLHNA